MTRIRWHCRKRSQSQHREHRGNRGIESAYHFQPNKRKENEEVVSEMRRRDDFPSIVVDSLAVDHTPHRVDLTERGVHALADEEDSTEGEAIPTDE